MVLPLTAPFTHTPFQLLAAQDVVAGSAAQVAESAAMAANFQVRLVTEDSRMAIDSKTSSRS